MTMKSPRKAKLRLLLADDHPMVREGIRSCLSRVPEFRIVGEAADGDEALRMTRELKPDLVLMDLNMPRLTGLQVTEVLHRELPQVRVLVLTVHSKSEYVVQMIRSGAHGFVSKDAAPAELIEAIAQVGGGGTRFSAEAAQRFLDEHLSEKHTRRHALSLREREILAHIADGVPNKLIASRLGVSVRTVETHRERLMAKLDIHTVAGLTRFAVAQGIVTLE